MGLLKIMKLKGYYPNSPTYQMTIKDLCSEKFVRDVGSVLRQMVNQGFVPRMGTWKKTNGCMLSKKMYI
ncbi:hypothetical protein IEQ34_016456 [Dendrobium chrysotoxum]|uniref:Uncharacterized protein n=1 Tax=Dendrobium chrysotoxum TaxID=161865 RepID=A0AAV7GG47_DENCH|nr:hypothetical protein IEQ34_016456 [Dendrobium chrysotoxum]